MMLWQARQWLGELIKNPRRVLVGRPALPTGPLPVQRTLCWGTHEEAARLGVAGQGTRAWAYRWIEEHVKALGDIGVLVDIGGGGVDSPLPNRLAQYADEVIVLDKMGHGERKGRIRQIACDLSDGFPAEIQPNTVDVIVSASALEHLSVDVQMLTFREMQRTLRHGGVFAGTVSYITGLTESTIATLRRDQVLEQTGSSVYCRFDIERCIDAAKSLHLPSSPVSWSVFPGYGGFTEDSLLVNDALVSDVCGSYGHEVCAREVDALALKWFELGVYLVKDAQA